VAPSFAPGVKKILYNELTMKKIIIPLLLLVLSTSTPIFAADSIIPALRKQIQNRVEVKKEIKEKREEIKDVKLENKKTKAQAILKRLRQGIVNRYENTLKHKAKIETRVGNNADAKAKLATFDDTKYKADLVLFDAKVTQIVASETPLKLTPELKVIAKDLNSDLKTMRQTLADTLRLIIAAKK